jgi:hypothetical protein
LNGHENSFLIVRGVGEQISLKTTKISGYKNVKQFLNFEYKIMSKVVVIFIISLSVEGVYYCANSQKA